MCPEKQFNLQSKVCTHETEITLLKSALSDALSRLNSVEEELKKVNAKTKKGMVISYTFDW